jgi:tRNA threonylcarbamoyladenosine biosynthesis protein TsaE
VILADEAATESCGFLIGQQLRVGDVVTLSGDLGAGKTCLARGILRGLGFAGDVPSPTFSIMISYDPPDVRVPVHHVDLYRLDTPDEADALAFEDALMDGALIIEWPDMIADRLWPETLKISLNRGAGDTRGLTAQVPPSWKDRCPFP